jgi:hypothetical protein
MPDWRNPLGYACNARADLPAEELLGVCASIQGLESGGSAFVAGASALGMNYLPLLLCTLDPSRWELQWGFDSQTGEVVAIKIMHFELVTPPDTFTADVIWKINAIRAKIRESLTPWGTNDSVPDTRRDSGQKGGGRGGGRDRDSAGNPYIWVSDLSEEIADLLQDIWPTPDPVQKSKKVHWCSACGEVDEEYDENPEVLTPLHPLAEEMDWTAMEAKESKSQKSKKGKNGTQGDILGHRPNVSQKDMQAIKGILKYLSNKPYPHEDKLSSLCGRFQTNKKTLAKFTDVFSCTELDRSEWNVRVIASGNGYEEPAKKGKGGGKGSAKAAAKASKGGGKGGGSSKSNAALDARIAELCRIPDIAVHPVDFDSRVRTWFVRFERRHGKRELENAFEVLGEWCTKKVRDSVRSWPSYLMVLLRNWERNEFEGGEDED